MSLALLLPMLALVPAGDDVGTLIAKSRAMIGERRCIPSPNGTDITVCGLRDADRRFRVPFIVHDEGDPRYEAVRVERDRLLHRTNPIEELTPFLVGGGMAGVTVSSASGVSGVTNRKLAP